MRGPGLRTTRPGRSAGASDAGAHGRGRARTAGPGLVGVLGLALVLAGPGDAGGPAWAAGPYVRPGVTVPARGPAPDGSAAPGSASSAGSGGTGSAAPQPASASQPKRDLSATSLSLSGKRAFDMARAADDGAGDALTEGEQTFARIRDLDPDDRGSDALRSVIESATASHATLTGYRRQAQASAGEALQSLTRALEVSSQAIPDPLRRDAMEQQALLSAYEAALMAARARAEAERLRALLAEGRALVAGVPLKPGGPVGRAWARPVSGATGLGSVPAASGGPGSGGSPASGGPASGTSASDSSLSGGSASRSSASGTSASGTSASGSPAVKAPAPGGAASGTVGGVEVPNVVGARLDAASRDLAAAGLRVGSTTGPRDGFVVKQTPEAGAHVGARSAVTLTLSGSAATTVEIPPK